MREPSAVRRVFVMFLFRRKSRVLDERDPSQNSCDAAISSRAEETPIVDSSELNPGRLKTPREDIGLLISEMNATKPP
jgi:hypothetical protein